MQQERKYQRENDDGWMDRLIDKNHFSLCFHLSRLSHFLRFALLSFYLFFGSFFSFFRSFLSFLSLFPPFSFLSLLRQSGNFRIYGRFFTITIVKTEYRLSKWYIFPSQPINRPIWSKYKARECITVTAIKKVSMNISINTFPLSVMKFSKIRLHRIRKHHAHP